MLAIEKKSSDAQCLAVFYFKMQFYSCIKIYFSLICIFINKIFQKAVEGNYLTHSIDSNDLKK